MGRKARIRGGKIAETEEGDTIPESVRLFDRFCSFLMRKAATSITRAEKGGGRYVKKSARKEECGTHFIECLRSCIKCAVAHDGMKKLKGCDTMIIKASDIRVGAQLAESDGFTFDVVEIVKETPKTITVRLCSDFSSIPAHWTVKPDGTPGGVLKTFRKSSKLYGTL